MHENLRFSFGFSSDCFGMERYIGFYTNMAIEISAAIFHIVISVTAASFHLGVCMYLGGMVQDLKWQFADINEKIHEKRHSVTSKLIIRQIDFHGNILK